LTDVIPIPGAEALRPVRRPALGYLMALAAAALFGVNGTVLKVALDDGLSAYRLAELRCLASLVIFVAVVAATRPGSLRVTGRELVYLAVFGACAVVLTQLLYLLAIRRLKIGVALVLIFLGPLLVALWVHFVGKKRVRPRFWAALALSLVGLVLVVRLWDRFSLDGLGVAFALAGAGAYTLYVLYAEHAVGRRDPISLLCYGFLFASALWTFVQPWWSLPWRSLVTDVSLHGNLAGSSLPEWALVAWIVVLGTVVPFILVVGSLQHLPATRVAICGMLEPVVAAIVAYAWLAETLDAAQLVGGALVLAAIGLAQTAR
jgi:drug/metabolite transporter (DMT)-like permease